MKISSIFLLVVVFVTCAVKAGEAAFVKYKDKDGKEYYVNTDYTKVPDQYLDQVRDQLQEIKEKAMPAANITPDTPGKNKQNLLSWTGNPSTFVTGSVQIFVSSNCQDCQRLETLLQVNQIKYMRYDVEYSSMGKEFYKTMGSTQLPITRIGDKLIQGNNINAVKNVLQKMAQAAQGPNQPAPTQTSGVKPD